MLCKWYSLFLRILVVHVCIVSTSIIPSILVRSVIVFFFSSRRRHTRLQGDWSSDVCSSDLLAAPGLVNASVDRRQVRAAAKQILPHDVGAEKLAAERFGQRRGQRRLAGSRQSSDRQHQRREPRSEERRVGKEGRSRGARESE